MRLVVLVAALTVACETPPVVGGVGSSLVLIDDRLAVVDPDAGSVSIVDRETLEALDRVDVGAEPRALLQTSAGVLFAVTRRGGELVEIALTGGAHVARRFSICAGPRALAESALGIVLVACEWDGTIRAFDPRSAEISIVASELHRPVAVTAIGETIYALEHQHGLLWRIDGTGRRAVSLVPSEAPARPALTAMNAHAASALLPVAGALAVAFELVNHSGDAKDEPIADDYGSLTEGRPKINPALRLFLANDLAPRDSAVTYARFDAAPDLRCNGPAALAQLDRDHLLVAHRSSGDLAVLAIGKTDRLQATYRVGNGPSGIAVDGARRIAWVDNALDASISRVDLDTGTITTRVRPLPASASLAALAGRRIFYDSTNAHVTPSGVLACATCHPDGGQDGLTWFIRAPKIAAKSRRTPDLGNALAATAPYHWDGQFTDRSSLVLSTVTDLMAGDALLLDADLVTAYLDELTAPPMAPPIDPAVGARGRAAFERADCARCHSGALFTDGKKHAVLAAEPASPTALPEADTPSLRGLFLRAPYFHDGRAASLEDLLSRSDAAAHGTAGTLSIDERADLLSYLRSL